MIRSTLQFSAFLDWNEYQYPPPPIHAWSAWRVVAWPIYTAAQQAWRQLPRVASAGVTPAGVMSAGGRAGVTPAGVTSAGVTSAGVTSARLTFAAQRVVPLPLDAVPGVVQNVHTLHRHVTGGESEAVVAHERANRLEQVVAGVSERTERHLVERGTGAAWQPTIVNYLFVYLLFIYWFIDLSMYFLFIYLCIYVFFIHLFIYLFTYLCICLFIYISVQYNSEIKLFFYVVLLNINAIFSY